VGPVNGPDYAARAAAGAAFLDDRIPGWAARINLATLNLAGECGCVLGQLGGDYTGMRDGLHLGSDAAVHLGFSLGPDTTWDDLEAKAELDAAWTREITTRREAGQVTA
jgi:hypothetical protein